MTATSTQTVPCPECGSQAELVVAYDVREPGQRKPISVDLICDNKCRPEPHQLDELINE